MVRKVPVPAAPSPKSSLAEPTDSSVENNVLDSLCAHLREVADKRSPHGKVHELVGVLSLIVVSLLVGKIGLSCVVAFALGHGARRRYNGEHRKRMSRVKSEQDKPPAKWLYDIGLLWRAIPTVPSVQTLIRILGGLSPADLQEAMSRWIVETLKTMRVRHYVGSADGKAMKAGGKHILSVFIHDLALVAMHEEVSGKKSELSTLRDRLSWLLERHPGLWLLCGDAIFADKTLCKLLNYNGRDWLFQIKDNQPNLSEKLEVIFSPIVRTEPHHSAPPEKKGSTWRSETIGLCLGRSKS